MSDSTTLRSSDRECEQLLAQEELIFDATELLCELMQQENISRKELAERLGKSKGFVSQVLTGERNMTLRTLSDFAFALGHRLRIEPDAMSSQADRPTDQTGWWRDLSRSSGPVDPKTQSAMRTALRRADASAPPGEAPDHDHLQAELLGLSEPP